MFHFIRQISKIKLPFLNDIQVCLDIGTSNVRVGIVGKGVVLSEAAYIGHNTHTREYLFFGNEAKAIVGKTPEFVKIVQPTVNGVISDFDAEVALIRKLIDKAVNPYLTSYPLVRPNLVAISSVPYIATEIEQKALVESLLKAGFSSTNIVQKPIATAAGANINVFSHHPHLVANLGGGLIELSIISGGGIVAEKTIRNGGDNMNKLIANYAYLKYGIILGEATCEELKIKLLNFGEENKTLVVRGKSLENGLPKSIKMKSSDVREALINSMTQIVDGIKELIEISPPEIVDEIYERGIYLTGALAQADEIDEFFANELKISVALIEHPEECTILGLMNIAKDRTQLEKLSNPSI